MVWTLDLLQTDKHMIFGSRRNRRSQREPKVLRGKDIPALAEYIKSEECKNVFLMVRWFTPRRQHSDHWNLLIQLGAGWSFVLMHEEDYWSTAAGIRCVKESVRLLAFLTSGHPELVCNLPDLYLSTTLEISLCTIYRTICMHLFSFDIFAHLESQSNLARLNLPHPEAVFEIGFFRKNPVPCTSYFLL